MRNVDMRRLVEYFRKGKLHVNQVASLILDDGESSHGWAIKRLSGDEISLISENGEITKEVNILTILDWEAEMPESDFEAAFSEVVGQDLDEFLRSINLRAQEINSDILHKISKVFDGIKLKKLNEDFVFEVVKELGVRGRFKSITSLLEKVIPIIETPHRYAHSMRLHLSSACREIRRPDKALDATEYLENSHSRIFPQDSVVYAALCTSRAAAFLDIAKIERAEYWAKRAYSLSGGRESAHLSNVFIRLDRMKVER